MKTLGPFARADFKVETVDRVHAARHGPGATVPSAYPSNAALYGGAGEAFGARQQHDDEDGETPRPKPVEFLGLLRCIIASA
jgi:hypothetical protein